MAASDWIHIADGNLVGGPGDSVVVMVDFNHPYMTPLINMAWPGFHLSSTRYAYVEQYRVSHTLNVPKPPAGPSDTPLPATWTYTPTSTATLPTSTSLGPAPPTPPPRRCSGRP